MSSSKAQFFSYDAIIGAMIFLIAFGLLMSYWWSIRTILNPERDEIIKDALRISNNLLTPGNPTYWNTLPDINASTRQLGFTNDFEKKELNISKLARLKNYMGTGAQFNETRYAAVKTNLMRTRFNYYITVSNETGLIDCSGNCTIGKPADNARNVVNVYRIATYENQTVSLRLQLWAAAS